MDGLLVVVLLVQDVLPEEVNWHMTLHCHVKVLDGEGAKVLLVSILVAEVVFKTLFHLVDGVEVGNQSCQEVPELNH